LKFHAIFALLLAVVLAGCGGGGGVSHLPDPGDPDQVEAEWTFAPADTSTLGVWTKDNAGSEFGGVSAVLKGNGQIQIISTGAVTGLTGITGTVTGAVDAEDGSFDITGGGIRATGVVNHSSGSVTVSRVGEPDITVEMSSATTTAANYSAYRGVWTGTYTMDDEDYALTFTVNEAGFITGNIAEGLAAGTLYGRVDEESGEITLTIPFVNASSTGWKFTTDQVQDGSVSGTITSHNIDDTRMGIWTATKG
jgi:hypothetical protein